MRSDYAVAVRGLIGKADPLAGFAFSRGDDDPWLSVPCATGDHGTAEWLPEPDREVAGLGYGEALDWDVRRAQSVCRDLCPLRRECLAGAKARRETFGIWGGVDFGLIDRAKRARKSAALAARRAAEADA